MDMHKPVLQYEAITFLLQQTTNSRYIHLESTHCLKYHVHCSAENDVNQISEDILIPNNNTAMSNDSISPCLGQ